MDSLEVTAFDSDPGNINDVLTNDLGTPGPGEIDDISTNKISDLSTEENTVLEKSNIPEALELIAPEEKELLHASIPGEFIDWHENSFNDILTVVSCSNPISVAGHDSHGSNALSSSISAPVASRDREVAETGSTCSNNVLSLESAGWFSQFYILAFLLYLVEEEPVECAYEVNYLIMCLVLSH
ncbi:hypothetical protein JCGZ_14719 [Jatropha curcas]|uniref:Uncharacterized protein n=1 Tax=Jatropha curcas TaxID=180498 RepID=A0A067K8E5_JATCU|nr:hypothetical protein JCGZ_14719 [Jatropha curcas]